MATLTTSWQYLGQQYIGSSGGNLYVRIYARYSEQDIANNRSYVYYQARSYYENSTYIQDSQGRIGVSGTGASYNGADCTRPTTGESVVVETSGWVSHNDEGKASVSCSASIDFPNWGWSGTAYGSADLPTIPRKAEITSAPNFNDEENPKITYKNVLGTKATSLQACISLTQSNDDIKYRNIPKNGSSYTFYLTEEERNILRNATISNSRTVYFFVRTTIGSTMYHSSVAKTLTIVNGNPTFTDFTYKDTNTKVTGVIGNNQVLVIGQSILQATISSSNKMIANKGATAKNYVAIIDDMNKSTNYSTSDLNIDLGVPKSSGIKRLNIRAYDSRNNSTLVYKDITVYDYDKPVINADVTRLNNFENQTTLKVSGTYSKLTIDNIDKNVITTLQYRYRESGGNWSNWKALISTIADGKFSCNDVVLSLDNTKAFEFEVQAIDKLETSTLSLKIDVGQAIFFISSNKKACYINGGIVPYFTEEEEW